MIESGIPLTIFHRHEPTITSVSITPHTPHFTFNLTRLLTQSSAYPAFLAPKPIASSPQTLS